MIYDVAIVGAGMAGASLAASLDLQLSVLLLEREDQPGYHATGRSAAFWDECYGGPDVQPLTSASGPFLASPPHDFAEESFLTPRGVLYLGQDDEKAETDQFLRQFSAQGVRLQNADRAFLERSIPSLDPVWTHGLYGPDCSDIDVARLHNAYLKQARKNGVDLLVRSSINAVQHASGGWKLISGQEQYRAQVLVNAAGAWADECALMAGVKPIGHTPYRRTMTQIRVSPPAEASLPLIIDFAGSFYFKPAGNGRLWLSPHDESSSDPCDAAPDEHDVALAIDRFTRATNWNVEAVESRWAGLRTFSPDRLPVYGFDNEFPNFFWCTGQGGFGIQTAPAAALLCAALLERKSLAPELSGINPTRFAPDRFSRSTISIL